MFESCAMESESAACRDATQYAKNPYSLGDQAEGRTSIRHGSGLAAHSQIELVMTLRQLAGCAQPARAPVNSTPALGRKS